MESSSSISGFVISLVVTLAFSGVALVACGDDDDDSGGEGEGEGEGEGDVVPYAIDETIEGLTYAEWSAAWWQFMEAIPTATNPIRDTTGEHCADGQEGPVFFLAGAGSADPVSRDCEIPADTTLFFPLINYLDDYPCPDPEFAPADGQTLEEFLTADAAGIMDNVTEVTCEIDGVVVPGVLESFRVHSSLFDFTGDVSWQEFDGCITGEQQQAVTDGWWLALPPLSTGNHTIHFTGDAPDMGFGQDVTYTVTVN